MLQKVLITFILGVGLFYIFFISLIPDSFVLIFKIIPMVLLIGLAISQRANNISKYKLLLIIGLIFCMIGDYAIGKVFEYGLLSFLIGHVFYISAFSTANERKVPTAAKVPLLLFGIAMALWIGGTLFSLGDTFLGIAVITYMAVILTMGWSSIRTNSNFALVGALLFIASDTVLAINKFVIDIPYSHQLIMLTYYAAQLFITLSISQYSFIRNKVIQ